MDFGIEKEKEAIIASRDGWFIPLPNAYENQSLPSRK